MRTLCVFYNKKKSINDRALSIIKLLRKNGYNVYINRYNKRAQLIVALGGDGTVLRAVNHTLTHSIPILPVSLGRLSFLSGTVQKNLFTDLDKFYQGKCKITVRDTLCIIVHRKFRKVFVPIVNEAVLTRNSYQRLFDISVRSVELNYQLRSDGLIISTPTGSTAYNLAAGGKVLPPQAKKYVLTPICPFFHAKNSQINRTSKVLDLKQPVFIKAEGKKPNFVVVCDGHRIIKFGTGDTLEVRRGKNTFSLIKF